MMDILQGPRDPHTLATTLALVNDTGVSVLAATGALVAVRNRMDPIGTTALAIVTAFGGGTIRDLLMGVPVFWVHEPIFLWIAGSTALLVFVLGYFVTLRPGFLLIPDAIGLALYTWVGAEKAHALGFSATITVLMAVLTGTAGGIIRDVLSNDVPSLFIESELYATASFLGALALVTCWTAGWTEPWAGGLCIGLILLLRLGALRWRIVLPAHPGIRA